MSLVELTSVDQAILPVQGLAEHLRLGTGFADDGLEDPVLEAYLRAALAAIEARTGKAILARDFAWEVSAWYAPDLQGLPVAPVTAVHRVVLIADGGAESVADPASFRLRKDATRPTLVAPGLLPIIPHDGWARIEFSAGFGTTWSEVPPDLRQAVMMLAAFFFENRHAAEGSGGVMPFGVIALIERYRAVRLVGDAL